MRDKLFLLEPGFDDPAYAARDDGFPDTRFYCPYCATIEGVLALFPQLGERVEVVRVPYPRPRPALIALVGEENQGLPCLVLADDAPDSLATGSYNGIRFVSGLNQILDAMSKRHALPRAHF